MKLDEKGTLSLPRTSIPYVSKNWVTTALEIILALAIKFKDNIEEIFVPRGKPEG
jgi:hypothetical protein